jgi:hypothetical protein
VSHGLPVLVRNSAPRESTAHVPGPARRLPGGAGGDTARVDESYAWVGAHQRLVTTAVAGGIGAYLLVVGITKL